jgi:hypothetical protein
VRRQVAYRQKIQSHKETHHAPHHTPATAVRVY